MISFQMSVVELKKALKAKGLTTTGKKQDLIDRLQLSMATEETEEENIDNDLLEDADVLLGDDNDEVVVEPSFVIFKATRYSVVGIFCTTFKNKTDENISFSYINEILIITLLILIRYIIGNILERCHGTPSEWLLHYCLQYSLSLTNIKSIEYLFSGQYLWRFCLQRPYSASSFIETG